METASSQPAISQPRLRAVTFRSVLLGLMGVVLICGLTAYNDYVVANTWFVGNYLPIGVLLGILVFLLLVNGPLWRFAPRFAFTRSEMGVALCMMLVSCAMPSSGLMRYLPGHLVGLWNRAGYSSDHANVMRQANLPDWVFPSFQSKDVQQRANDPVVRQFMQRVPLDEPTFVNRVMAVPWAKWVRPAFTWALLIAALAGAILCMSVIFRRQWVDNERLPFPLANVYLSLIEEPKPGTMFNTLFSSQLFWISAGAIFLLHGLNGLHRYFPLVPAISRSYDLSGILANPPLSYIDQSMKAATVYFCMVGIVYFLQSNVALSLWLSVFVVQAVRIYMGTHKADLTISMKIDQSLGAIIVFAATILFIARHHLTLVARQMFRPARVGEAEGRYLPYAVAGWGLLLCMAGMATWLMAVGASLAGAITIVLTGGIIYLVAARVVAETGLIFVQLQTSLARPWVVLAQAMPPAATVKTTTTSFFLASWMNTLFTYDLRESLTGFLPQSLRIADGASFEQEHNSRRVWPFTLCLIGALGLAYFVSGAAMLYCEYNYAATLDRNQYSPLNQWGVDNTCVHTLDQTRDYMVRGGPADAHDRWEHITIGAAVTGLLGLLRLRFAGWPFHPVGFLLAYTYPLEKIWLSIMVGWMLKVLVLRFGGASMYRSAKPVFMGLIIGEAGAAALWLLVSLVLQALGLPYVAVNLLPT